jgi:Ca2+-binding EF-hand superfamily protein
MSIKMQFIPDTVTIVEANDRKLPISSNPFEKSALEQLNISRRGTVHLTIRSIRNLKCIFSEKDDKRNVAMALRWRNNTNIVGVTKSFQLPKNDSNFVTWDQQFIFPVFASSGLEMLNLNVIGLSGDEELYSNENIIGSTSFPLFPFIFLDGHVMDNWYPLESEYGSSKVGEVFISLQFLAEGSRVYGQKDTSSQSIEDSQKYLTVTVDAGKGLRDPSWKGRTDPVVELQIVEGTKNVMGAMISSNPCVSKQNNPSWGDILQLPTKKEMEHSSGIFLEVVVRNTCKRRGDGVIARGKILLDPTTFNKSTVFNKWIELERENSGGGDTFNSIKPSIHLLIQGYGACPHIEKSFKCHRGSYLLLEVMEASEIPIDSFIDQDPFVHLELITKDKKDPVNSKVLMEWDSEPHVNGGSHPSWVHHAMLPIEDEYPLSSLTLCASIINSESETNDVAVQLCSAVLPLQSLSTINSYEPSDLWLDLAKSEGIEGESNAKLHVKLTKLLKAKGSLKITIMSAKGITFSDAFCKARLSLRNSKWYATDVSPSSSSPTWNKEISLSYSTDNLNLTDIPMVHFSVFDDNGKVEKNHLGSSSVSIFRCLATPGKVIEEWFPLYGDGCAGDIKVKMVFESENADVSVAATKGTVLDAPSFDVGDVNKLAAMKRLFYFFDNDNSGRISRDEFEQALTGKDVIANDPFIAKLMGKNMFEVLDRNGDGGVSWEEFVEFLEGHLCENKNIDNQESDNKMSVIQEGEKKEKDRIIMELQEEIRKLKSNSIADLKPTKPSRSRSNSESSVPRSVDRGSIESPKTSRSITASKLAQAKKLASNVKKDFDSGDKKEEPCIWNVCKCRIHCPQNDTGNNHVHSIYNKHQSWYPRFEQGQEKMEEEIYNLKKKEERMQQVSVIP